MTFVLWALPVLPLVAGGLLAVAGALRRQTDRVAAPMSLAVAGGVLVLAVAAAVGRPEVRAPLLPGVDAALAVDGLSAVMVVTVAAVSFLVLLFSAAELGADEPRARFFGLMLLFVGAMLLTVTARNLLVLLAAWELMGATSYALIAFWWRDRERVHSANTAFLVTRAADLGQYFAAGAALAGAGSMAFAALPDASPGWRNAIAAGLVVSALGKSAQLPFSFWISRAMAGPSPVSALLHSATMVAAGGYLLLRIRPLLESTPWGGPTVAWAGALTALAMGAVAVVQRDVKQLLAASTSAQIGFVVLAAGVGASAAGTAQLVAHAAVKSALFLVAGAWLSARGTKALRLLRGAAREDRVLGVVAGAGLLTLAGIPPLSLWLTKDSVLAVAREGSLALYVVGMAASLLSAAYAGRALAVLYDRPSRREQPGPGDLEERPTGRVSRTGITAAGLLAAAGAVLGVQALPGIERRYAASFGGSSVLPTPSELALSAGLAVLLVAVLLRLHGVLPAREAATWRPLHAWLGLEPAATLVVLGPTLALARAAARADDRVIDGAVEGVARLARRTAARAEEGDAGLVDGGVRSVVGGARRLGALARRPQTGQLHQYYAQAAVGMVALVLVVLIGR